MDYLRSIAVKVISRPTNEDQDLPVRVPAWLYEGGLAQLEEVMKGPLVAKDIGESNFLFMGRPIAVEKN